MANYVAVFRKGLTLKKQEQFKKNCVAKSFYKIDGEFPFCLHELLYFYKEELIDDDDYFYRIDSPKTLLLIKSMGLDSPKFIFKIDKSFKKETLSLYPLVDAYQKVLNIVYDLDSSVMNYASIANRVINRTIPSSRFNSNKYHVVLKKEQSIIEDSVSNLLNPRLA